MSANTETCANNNKSVCDYNEFRRLRYFHGMLLDEKDFREEQQYHANKRRLLNRMLHGSGVVCGLELRGKKGKRSIQISSGLALDCSGNEIWVSKDLKIDLATLLPPKNKPKGEPECRPEDEEANLKTYYIGIRYEEKPTNPISVYLPSGDCEERTCENSRWKEGYCVEIVECCYEDEQPGLLTAFCECEGNGSLDKEKYKDQCGKCPPDPNETEEPGAEPNPGRDKEWCQCMVFQDFCESSVPCPECCSCDHPCHVILGQIKIDPKTGLLVTVCMNECRRYVLTGRLVQQILVRIFSGASTLIDMKVGDESDELPNNLEDYIYNPFKALCWWLPYKLKGGQFDWLECKGRPATAPAPAPAPDTATALAQVVDQRVEANRQALLVEFDRKINEKFDEFAKTRPTELAKVVDQRVEANKQALLVEFDRKLDAKLAEFARSRPTETEASATTKVTESEAPADKPSPKPSKK